MRDKIRLTLFNPERARESIKSQWVHSLSLSGLKRVNRILSLILVRHFFQTATAADAAKNQLDIFEDLLIFRRFDRPLANAVIKRLQTHLWFTSPEYVVFSLASRHLPDAAKQDLAAAILAQPRNRLRPGKVAMAPLTARATLATRVTDQSPYFFIALGIDMAFLDESAQDWPPIPAFIKFSNFVNCFPLTNDATERAIKRTSD